MYQTRLIPKEELDIILPLLRLLNEKTDSTILEERLNEIRGNNYECVGVFDNDKLVGISGLWILNKIYVGKHVEPDNVVVLPEYRSKGIGEMMMQWIYDYGKSQGCVASELNCYVNNHKGVRFWISQGYRILGFHMQRML